jgi:hypothetical protein
MRALGIGDNQERIRQEDMDEYAKLFKQLLSDAHIGALAALFGWSHPDLYVSERDSCPV